MVSEIFLHFPSPIPPFPRMDLLILQYFRHALTTVNTYLMQYVFISCMFSVILMFDIRT